MRLIGYLLVLGAVLVIIKYVALVAVVALVCATVVALVRRQPSSLRHRATPAPKPPRTEFIVTDGTCSCGLPERVHIMSDGEVDVSRFHG